MIDTDEKPQENGGEEAVPFDDCLRLLVNTPPKPKKADKSGHEETDVDGDEA